MLRHNCSQYILFPRVGTAPEHFLQGTRLMVGRLPEGMRILFISGKAGEAERALPSPSLLSPLVPQVPWSMYTCLFPSSPRRTKRSTRLLCCGPAKWARSLTCGGTEITPRWVGLPRGLCAAPRKLAKVQKGKKVMAYVTQETRGCRSSGDGGLRVPQSSPQSLSLSPLCPPLFFFF